MDRITLIYTKLGYTLRFMQCDEDAFCIQMKSLLQSIALYSDDRKYQGS